MTGQGLTLEQSPAEPPAPAPEAAPVDPQAIPQGDQYIQNVGAQADHCVRSCDGQPGPSGGDYMIVPTAEPAYLANVGAQTPHKVR